MILMAAACATSAISRADQPAKPPVAAAKVIDLGGSTVLQLKDGQFFVERHESQLYYCLLADRVGAITKQFSRQGKLPSALLDANFQDVMEIDLGIPAWHEYPVILRGMNVLAGVLRLKADRDSPAWATIRIDEIPAADPTCSGARSCGRMEPRANAFDFLVEGRMCEPARADLSGT